MPVDAVAWRRTVETTVRDTASHFGADADDLLDSMSFLESLDPYVDLIGEDLSEAVTESVADWVVEADREPYGDVTYADPGYQDDGVKRYPLDNERHCRAAWSYINMSKNAAKYSSEQLSRIKGRIREALEQYGVETSEATVPGRVTEAEDTVFGRIIEARGNGADGGRVFRVRLLAYGDSNNGRRYTEAVMRRAVALYEGARAYDRHRTADELRSSTIAGLVGSYRDVTAESDGLYGNLHLLPSATHAAEALDASIAAEAAGRQPLVGLSHDVVATFRPAVGPRGRIQEATAIQRVQSIDLIADPSAGGRAVRAVAGGTDPERELDVPVTTNDVLAALQSATPEQLAAHGLTRTGTRTTEGGSDGDTGEPKTSFMAKLMIRQKVADAGLPERVVEALTDALPERFSEAEIDAHIAGLKSAMGLIERADLAPTAVTTITREAQDKKVEALDAFFAQDWGKGYHSFRQAWQDFTGYRPRAFDEDVSRRIMRESFGGGFDSGERATESMDSTTWAQVLGDSVTRRLVAAYNTPTLQTWRQIVSATIPVADFRTQRVGRVGGYGTLPTVAEGGPYNPLTSPGDEEATGALVKRGGTEDVTLEMVANDDRRAISQIPTKLGRAAAQTLYRSVFDTLANNDTCTFDSTTLFHANHANTDTSAGLQQSTLTTGRRKMIEQAAYGDTSEILALTPRTLIVPPELEETAFVLAGSRAVPASNTVGASDQPNIHAGINVLLVPYFTDANDWFLVADPANVPTLEVGFFNGRQEPELFTQSDPNVGSVFNSDVFTWKVRFVYYVMILDYRGFYRGVG